MADFDFVNWGNTTIVGEWVMETGSGVYRGQCTQAVTQLLKDLGVADYGAARGNGNQVGPNMVVRGEATYEGTNLASIPTNEVHIICKDVGNTSTTGHVSVSAVGDIVFEQNVNVGGPTQNYGIGPTYPGRLGRLGEAWRGTRYHYKLIADTDFDNIDGDDGGGDPGDDPIGPNQNRFLRSGIIDIKKKSLSKINSIKDHKKYYVIKVVKRGINQA